MIYIFLFTIKKKKGLLFFFLVIRHTPLNMQPCSGVLLQLKEKAKKAIKKELDKVCTKMNKKNLRFIILTIVPY